MKSQTEPGLAPRSFAGGVERSPRPSSRQSPRSSLGFYFARAPALGMRLQAWSDSKRISIVTYFRSIASELMWGKRLPF